MKNFIRPLLPLNFNLGGRASGLLPLLVLLFSLYPIFSSGPQDLLLPSSAARPGQSSTQLPDGRWLLLGGEDSNKTANSAASIWDPQTAQLIPLGSLNHARAWHSATLLPDGTVLIFGGFGADGKLVANAELYDSDTKSFHTLPSIGLTPRAKHTATLLTDGSLLFAGGSSEAGNIFNDAELWNFEDGVVDRLSSKLNDARYGHAAALLSDGTVLLSGGLDRHGDSLSDGELFDPATEQFTAASAIEVQNLKSTSHTPQVTASIPANGATDAAVDALIAIRFSTPMRVESVNSDTVFISGLNRIEAAEIVPAENGMLAFITPDSSLATGTTYTVTLNGPVDRNGFLLPVASFSFTIEGSAAGGSGSTGSGPGTSPTLTPEGSKSGADDDGYVWQGELKDAKPHSPWQDLPPLRAEPGVTALAGQILDLRGEPLANITLEIGYGSEQKKTKTDNTGRFLLEAIEAEWSELLIDARHGHNPKSGVEDPKWGYGVFEYGLDITEGQTTVLPFTIWLPKIDVANTTTVPSPANSEVVITTPKIPGLEVHIPPSTVLYDHDWEVAKEINVTRIPQDRPPFPLPKGVVTPALFTIQPGGGYVRGSQGVRLVYPNFSDKPLIAGTRFNFWHYDPDYRGWYVYGLGTVTENGAQIVPDPGIVIREFTGAMVGPPGLKPNEGRQCREGQDCNKGDPVDLQTGIFQLDKTDLFLPDVMPIKFTRTYRTRDTTSRAFGIGASHSYDYFLVGDTLPYTFQEVVFPDGGSLRYDRIDGGAGNDFTVAVYEHATRPGRFFKSRISWNGSGWDLKLKDGTIYKFRDGMAATRPGQGGLIRIQDRNGNAHDITRDANGNVTKITSFPSGRWIELSNDTVNNRIDQAKDNSGRTVIYTYDGTGRLFTVTDPNLKVTEYGYEDGSQRMTTIKDPLLITFLTNDYDPSTGRITKQTQADTTFFLFNYTLNGSNVIQTDVTDPRGNISRVTFNADGQVLTNTEGLGTPDEKLTTYERQTGTNLVLSVTDALVVNGLNRKTAYTYDAMGNILSITRMAQDPPNSVTTNFTYEPDFNQLETITDPLSHPTTFGHSDGKGNVTSIKNALDKIWTILPNAAGQPASITDPLGNVTQFTYSLANNTGDLNSVIDPLTNTTTRFTDAVGRLIRLTDALGNTTLYDYDSLNRLTKVTDSLNGTTEFTYDDNGNLRFVKDARSNQTEYTYNNMDQLATRKDPLLRQETYTLYDGNGNLGRFTDRKSPPQITDYTYDALNRRKLVTYADSSTTSYTYDKGNRLTQIVDSIAGTITRTYDGLDRLTSETTPQGSVSYTYDNAGRRISMTVAGQPTVNYPVYDNANRLKQITQGASTVSFDYDDAGRRTSLTLPNGILVQYGYDKASRVTSITYTLGQTVLGDLTYDYDKAGNRTRIGGSWARTGIPQAITTTNYDSANQQLTFGNKTLNYDNNGNLTSIVDGSGTTLYTWNPRNQLASISGPGLSASFAYDGSGRREQKTVNSSLTEFLYDGINPVQETSGATVLANIMTGLDVDGLLNRADVGSSSTSNLLRDALGSVIALTDSAGAVQTEYTYEPFGKTSVTGVNNTNSAQFTGRENDGTELYFYRARYYDSTRQRFVSEDTFECGTNYVLPVKLLKQNSQYSNLYSYVNNRAMNLSDPLGLCPDCSYYDGRCNEVTGWFSKSYYCWAAKKVCNNTACNELTNCVRKCLQDFDRDNCRTLPGGRKDPYGLASLCAEIPGHLACMSIGGPCLPYLDSTQP